MKSQRMRKRERMRWMIRNRVTDRGDNKKEKKHDIEKDDDQ